MSLRVSSHWKSWHDLSRKKLRRCRWAVLHWAVLVWLAGCSPEGEDCSHNELLGTWSFKTSSQQDSCCPSQPPPPLLVLLLLRLLLLLLLCRIKRVWLFSLTVLIIVFGLEHTSPVTETLILFSNQIIWNAKQNKVYALFLNYLVKHSVFFLLQHKQSNPLFKNTSDTTNFSSQFRSWLKHN